MCARFDFCACVWVHSRKLYKLSFAVRNAKLCLWVKGPLKHDAQKSWPINWNFVVTLRFDIYFSSLYNGKYTFLGLLAKIKCSICSYQFNIWYTGNAQYSILNEFFWGATTELCLHSGSKDGHGQAQRRGRPPLSLHSAQFVEEWFPIQRLITFCCLRTDDYTFSSAFFVRMFQPGWNPEHLR